VMFEHLLQVVLDKENTRLYTKTIYLSRMVVVYLFPWTLESSSGNKPE
jgi:hypothetical protein